MQHFLEISQLTREAIEHLLHRALHFKQTTSYPDYSQYTLANLFYENSTRTQVSFELAAKKLSMTVVNLHVASSSAAKGESLADTCRTLAAMGVNIFVIRHSQNGVLKTLAHSLADTAHIINAGEGTCAHPSQAMLDLMTIYEQKPQLTKLKITIIGNIRHSRVANSLQYLCASVGIKQLTLVAPVIWQPMQPYFGEVTDCLHEGVAKADVIICLRVQKERLAEHEQFDLETYTQKFMLTDEILQYAKPDAMIMHPGPMNRGVEIASDVADGPQSFILPQVANGIYMRMAILETLDLFRNSLQMDIG